MAAESSLLSALLAFQAEAPTLTKDATNPHFRSKYTPLDTIVETVGPLLSKHGLVWTSMPGGTHEEPALEYVLWHTESNGSIRGSMPLLLDKSSSQGFGSAITYARRYALCAVLNLVADEDDDGNAAGERQAQPKRQPQMKDPHAPASDEQRKFLGTLLKRAKITKQDDANRVLSIFTGREITGGTGELSKQDASTIIERLKNGEVPSVQHPSDVPGAADGEFVHPSEEQSIQQVIETFDAVEEPAS